MVGRQFSAHFAYPSKPPCAIGADSSELTAVSRVEDGVGGPLVVAVGPGDSYDTTRVDGIESL